MPMNSISFHLGYHGIVRVTPPHPPPHPASQVLHWWGGLRAEQLLSWGPLASSESPWSVMQAPSRFRGVLGNGCPCTSHFLGG